MFRTREGGRIVPVPRAQGGGGSCQFVVVGVFYVVPVFTRREGGGSLSLGRSKLMEHATLRGVIYRDIWTQFREGLGV